jgi:GH24 family phage-related lysozyme (muramidase)
MFEDTKESFSEARQERGKAIRKSIYGNTGFLGTVLQRIEDDKVRDEKDQKAANKINESTQAITSRNATLSSMQVTFMQISKNLQNIAKLWDAETVLLEETKGQGQAPQTAPIAAPPLAATKKAPEGPVSVGGEPMGDGSSMLTGLSAIAGVLGLLKGKLLKMAKKKLLDKAAQAAKKMAAKMAAKKAVKAAAEKVAKRAAKRAAQSAAKKTAKEAAKEAAKKASKDATKAAGKATGKAAAKKASEAAIKQAAKKGVAKAIGKTALKSIPLIGAGIGLIFAAQRIIEGDYAGAGVEAAGGIAGPITAIPAAVILIAHDTYRAVYGVSYHSDDPEVREERLNGIKKIVQTMMADEMADKLKDKQAQQVKETEAAAAATNEFGDDYSSTDLTPEITPPPVPKSAPPPSLESKPQASTRSIGSGVKPGGGMGLKAPSGSLDMGMKMTMQHEGVRYKPYKDSLGLWTIGVGHLIGDGKTLPDEWNRTLSHDEVMALYEKDYEHHKEYAQRIPAFNNMNESGKSALIDLTFNMGPSWYKKWPTLMKQLSAGSFDEAADNLLDSKWARQVKGRAITITELIRNGGGEAATPGKDIATASSDVVMSKRDKKAGSTVNNVLVTNNTAVIKRAASPQPQVEHTSRVA